MGTLTVDGWTRKRLADFNAEFDVALIDAYGGGFVTDNTNPIMRLTGIVSSMLASAEEGNEGAYFSQYPSTASGTSLDSTAAITGTVRQGDSQSTVVMRLAGTPSASIPVGIVVSVDQTEDQFEIVNSVVLNSIPHASVSGLVQAAGTATATTSSPHGFSNGDWIFVVGADQEEYNGAKLISNIAASTFDYSVDTGTTSPATGTISAKPTIPADFQSREVGAISALADTINTIETPVAGLENAQNSEDAVEGRLTETDSEFRSRRESGIAQLGAGTVESIIATLKNVAGVTSAIVFQNATGEIKDGRPPYSVESFVTGGADQDIADALKAAFADGTRSFGTEGPFTVVDSEGVDQEDYYFSRLTSAEVWVIVNLVKNTDPDEGAVWDDVQGPIDVKAAIINYGDTLEPGHDVPVLPYLMSAVGEVAGIKSVTSLYASKINPPTTDTPIVILSTEQATFDTSRITVNVTP